MEKLWLKQYPQGVPTEVNLEAYISVNDILARSRERFGPLPAYSCMGVSITYGELDRFSRAFAAFLQKVLAFNKGERVAIMLPNLMQYR